jgi:hypothetical protein
MSYQEDEVWQGLIDKSFEEMMLKDLDRRLDELENAGTEERTE